MARNPRRDSPADPTPPAPPPPATGGSDREKIIEAFLALLTEKPFERIGFGDIAARSGVSLADCRGAFTSTLGVVAGFLRDIDRKVLAASTADMAEEPPRERLFDVLMRRIETLAPHRESVRSLVRSASRNPPFALALNGLTVRSLQWMLTAADIGAAGPVGMIRAQGLALLYARVLRTWLNDDDPGLARTLAELDRALARGARFAGMLDGLCRFAPGCGSRRSRRRSRYDDPAGEEPIPA